MKILLFLRLEFNPLCAKYQGCSALMLGLGLEASTHYTTRRSYDSASHEQSCEQTPHTTRADCWASRLAYAHFTICLSKCAIEVHDQSWRFNMPNSGEWTHESVVQLENLHAWWCRACVTIPVVELCSVRRPLDALQPFSRHRPWQWYQMPWALWV